MRRIDQLEQGARQPRVLCDQFGNGFQVRVRHVLLELQIDHDLRLRRDGDALQGLLDLFGGEFLGHACTLVWDCQFYRDAPHRTNRWISELELS